MDSTSRRYPRYALEARVTLRGARTNVSGRSENLSRGGMCAVVDRPVAVGAQVMVELALLFDTQCFSEPLLLTARVVWCTSLGEHHQVGLAFQQLEAERAEYLDIFLRYLKEGEVAAPAVAKATAAWERFDR